MKKNKTKHYPERELGRIQDVDEGMEAESLSSMTPKNLPETLDPHLGNFDCF
jgi:hypothetical protein